VEISRDYSEKEATSLCQLVQIKVDPVPLFKIKRLAITLTNKMSCSAYRTLCDCFGLVTH
jgi:hypothetical protein